MNKLFFSFLLALVVSFGASAQDKNLRELPQVNIKTLTGETVTTSEFANEGKPVIISFWATWCKPCITELNNISYVYDEWQQETGVKLVAVSIDDARNVSRIAPMVNGRGWEYDVYVDQNQDLKRALNVNNVPHTFLLNGKGEIVWQHNAYAEGDEDRLYELVQQLARGEEIEKH